MATMFDKIKKQNGEHFAKAIRNYNNGIFEIPDLDKIVKYAGRDAEPIMNYLVSLMDVQIEEHTVHQNPIKLLEMAGYDAFVVRNLIQQNSIKKYYASGEELCTFRDSDRYKNYYMIHAVKKNVKNIKRKDFKKPDRQDEYGTSVISIQILKTGGFISIKNRYNHTVENPDSTFNSNPDNIIRGLSDALKHYFDVDFSSQKVTVPNGYIVWHGQIIKYNFEFENTYIGDNFYIENGSKEITHIDPSTQIMMDHFILDLKTKKLLNPFNKSDSFFDAFNQELQSCEKITVKKDADKQRGIYLDGVCYARVKDGKITYLHMPNVTEIGNFFLDQNKSLDEISLPNAKSIGDCFFSSNKNLTAISLPNVTTIGKDFLLNNQNLVEISLPNVIKIEKRFLASNHDLTQISLPKATEIGNVFLYNNQNLSEVSLPNVTKIGTHFLSSNNSLKKLSLPNVREIEVFALIHNETLEELSLPKVEIIHSGLMTNNTNLTYAYLPNLKTIGEQCLQYAPKLKNISLPKVENIGSLFLCHATGLETISMPNVKQIGRNCLWGNKKVSEISLPNIESVEKGFMGVEDDQKIADIIKNKMYKRPSSREKFIEGMQKIRDRAQSLYRTITTQNQGME